MTLAVVLLVSLSCASAEPLAAATTSKSAEQQTSSSKPAAAGAQDQGTTPAAQNPPASSKAASAASDQAPSGSNGPTKRPKHRRRVLPPNCDSAPASGAATAGSAPSGSTPQAAVSAGSTSTAAPGTAPSNCPPSKTVVPHGGTSEPNIQLAGGPVGNQASQQRDAANQMLATTEENLKKIAGRELTADQQDIVNQTKQFVEQAKAAVAAEDFDRARTLAWKAQTLSGELANPQK
jgi:hypothetical protein